MKHHQFVMSTDCRAQSRMATVTCTTLMPCSEQACLCVIGALRTLDPRLMKSKHPKRWAFLPTSDQSSRWLIKAVPDGKHGPQCWECWSFLNFGVSTRIGSRVVRSGSGVSEGIRGLLLGHHLGLFLVVELHTHTHLGLGDICKCFWDQPSLLCPSPERGFHLQGCSLTFPFSQSC